MTQPHDPPDPPGPPGGRHTSGEPWQAFLAAPLGIVVFVVVNAVVFISAASLGGGSGNVVLIVIAVILLLVALAGIPLLVRGTSYFGKGPGIGLMIGWALVSIVSAGFCTGINPGLYSAPPLWQAPGRPHEWPQGCHFAGTASCATSSPTARPATPSARSGRCPRSPGCPANWWSATAGYGWNGAARSTA